MLLCLLIVALRWVCIRRKIQLKRVKSDPEIARPYVVEEPRSISQGAGILSSVTLAREAKARREHIITTSPVSERGDITVAHGPTSPLNTTRADSMQSTSSNERSRVIFHRDGGSVSLQAAVLSDIVEFPPSYDDVPSTTGTRGRPRR